MECIAKTNIYFVILEIKIEVLLWRVLPKPAKSRFSHGEYCKNKLRLEWRAKPKFVHGMYCKNQHMICHLGDKINVSVWKVLQKLASFESVGVAFEPTGTVFEVADVFFEFTRVDTEHTSVVFELTGAGLEHTRIVFEPATVVVHQ